MQISYRTASDRMAARIAATPTSQNRLRLLIGIFIFIMLCDFIFRGIMPSLSSGRNDFSDPYIGSWLWTHGQNPYDSSLVGLTATRLTHSTLSVVPIYPLTTYLLVAPFSLLPWKWANLAWTIVSGAGIGLMSWTLVRIAGFKISETRAWVLTGLVLGFTPVHRALHTENAAIIAVAICLLAVHLASESKELWAGALLAVATGLKPQLGIWILFFFLVQRRWRIVAMAAAAFAALFVLACVRIPESARTVFISYRDDLHYWFGPGGPNDFTAGNSLRFQLVNLQVIFWQWLHEARAANIAASAIFLFGLLVWMWTMMRGRRSKLGLTALLALSFLSFYHSVTDVSVLLLGFCWLLSDDDRHLRWTKLSAFLLLLGLAVPSHSLLLRLESHLSQSAISAWWWTGIIAPSFIWNMLLLNIVLIYALVTSEAGAFSEPGRH